MGYIDVTDATFETEVIALSHNTPVVVDLWAPWCGPCRTLGPIIESVIDATKGAVVLVKVNVDENPAISQAFQVQSIPAVFALHKGRVVDTFVGANGQAFVQDFVARLAPLGSPVAIPEGALTVAQLLALGDEESLLQALDLEPDNPEPPLALAELWISIDREKDALTLLSRMPQSLDTARVADLARQKLLSRDDGNDARLTALLDHVKLDETARAQFLELLDEMGPHDPRTAPYRRKMTSRLY